MSVDAVELEFEVACAFRSARALVAVLCERPKVTPIPENYSETGWLDDWELPLEDKITEAVVYAIRQIQFAVLSDFRRRNDELQDELSVQESIETDIDELQMFISN